MFNCLLIKITYNSRGLPVRSYRTIAAHELMLGRGAECNVHLPDPRLSMHHAVIKQNEEGHFVIQALNGELEADGALIPGTELSYGTRLMVGPYELKMSLRRRMSTWLFHWYWHIACRMIFRILKLVPTSRSQVHHHLKGAYPFFLQD